MYKIRHIIFIALSFLVAVLFIDCKDPGVFEEKNEISNGTTNGKDGISINWLGSFASKDEIENPKYLDAYFNSTDGCSYIYDGIKWELLARGNAEKQEGHNHTYSEEWSINDDFHWHVASCEHGEQITDLGAHNYVFNKVIEPAECEKNGVAEYICICGKRTEKTIPPTGHSNSEKWSYDKKNHWREATCGHQLISKNEEHIFGDVEIYEATDTSNKIEKRICSVCIFYDIHEYFGTMLHEHSYDIKTFACVCGKVRELSVQEFLTAIGNSPMIITADSSKPGITPLEDITGVNVYGVSISGEFNEKNHFPSSLSIADLRGLDTSNVTNMSYLFYDCKYLEVADVSTFDTTKVTDMNNMFKQCNNLLKFEKGDFFESFKNVLSLPIDFLVSNGSFDLNYLTNLNSCDFSNFNTSKVTNMSCMFSDCYSLTNLDVKYFDTSKVSDMSNMFYYCSSLTNLDVNTFDTSKVLNMSNMFLKCSNLKTLDLSFFDTSKVINMSNMFGDCHKLSYLNICNFDTSNVTNMSGIFAYCDILESIEISNFETIKVTDMSHMFEYCKNFRSLDLRSFNTLNVIDMSSMFSNCSIVFEITVSDEFVVTSVNKSKEMFSECRNLSGAISYDPLKTDATYANPETGYFTLKQ